MKVFSWYLVGSLSALCYSKNEFNDDCVRDAILLFSQINEHKSNFMMAREITNLLQNEYSNSGIVDFNFQCAVFDQADNAAIIGDAWQVDIPRMNNPRETTNKAAVCIKGAKTVGKALYGDDTRWTLMPNMDLCQFYDSADKCAKLMKISLRKVCQCGSGKAIVAKRGAGYVATSYAKQYRGRKWDIFFFCDGQKVDC